MMNIENYLPYLFQLIATVIGFAFILGRYKSTFDQHDKILNQHEKVIESILNRIDTANGEINFMKGFVFGKKQE